MSPSFSMIIPVTLYLTFIIITTATTECPDHLHCDLCLDNEAFSMGTYRILKSGKYCLSEDIVFNPREPEDVSSPNSNIYNWYPGEYGEFDFLSYPGTLGNIARGDAINGPFAGGFFAAISVETVDVEIDLNGYSISQHPHFYTQQRFYSNIEVQNKPYDELSKRTTGIWMWGPNAVVDNVYIHNGELGLSSHHGIHSNGATNVVIQDLIIHDFEVGGIQFNDFDNITLRNIEIGPSATNVKLNGYYGNARYDLITLNYLDHTQPQHDWILFSDGRNKSLLEIENHLIAAMDIAFRYANDELTDQDYANPWYDIALDLFATEATGENNDEYLPDGSTIYGVLFNSLLDAVQGFGQSNQYGGDDTVITKGVTIDNVYIHDLKKKVNEVPAIYMNKCYTDQEIWGSFLYGRQNWFDVVRTPLGSTFDLRRMIPDGYNIIDDGIIAGDNGKSLYSEYLQYQGNVLSDAQISIKLYDVFKSRINTIMADWAVEDYYADFGSIKDGIDDTAAQQLIGSELPECMEFLCNSDIIFQTNKGVIGARFDQIQNVEIKDLTIENLHNLSPLGSSACSSYSGPSDGGNPYQIDGAGNMNGHIRGISIMGSGVEFNGDININNLYSSYGDIYGIHIMRDSFIIFDSNETDDIPLIMSISELYPEFELTADKLDELIINNQSPFPNNFNGQCNILIDDTSDDDSHTFRGVSSDRGEIYIDGVPIGIDEIICKAPDNLPQIEPFTTSDKMEEITNGIIKEKDNGEIKINYIHIVYIVLVSIFCVAIIGFIGCIVCYYRKYLKEESIINDDEENELKRSLINEHENYGTIS